MTLYKRLSIISDHIEWRLKNNQAINLEELTKIFRVKENERNVYRNFMEGCVNLVVKENKKVIIDSSIPTFKNEMLKYGGGATLAFTCFFNPLHAYTFPVGILLVANIIRDINRKMKHEVSCYGDIQTYEDLEKINSVTLKKKLLEDTYNKLLPSQHPLNH